LAATAQAWLASHPDWAASTRARNEGIVDKHILPRWGGVQLADITVEEIQQWMGGLKLSAGSIRKIVGVLASICDQAVLTKRLATNPARLVARPRQQVKKRRYLDALQVERLSDAAGRMGDVVLVLAYTGLRWGEMAALTDGAVDTRRRRLRIERSVTEVRGHLVWSEPKDHQRRSVPYPAFLDGMIGSRIEAAEVGEPLFPSPSGGALRIGNARRDWFDRAASAAGVQGLTPHELRHTAASLAVHAGASVLALQRMLGHDKPSTTLDVYSDLFDEDLDRVADQLSTARDAALADYLRTEHQSEPL
ncbi:MAG: site-specific integrase, partial [Propionibacterium sp.]